MSQHSNDVRYAGTCVTREIPRMDGLPGSLDVALCRLAAECSDAAVDRAVRNLERESRTAETTVESEALRLAATHLRDARRDTDA